MRRSQRNYSLEEYFGAEVMSPYPCEYFDGEITLIGGESIAHDTIAANVVGIVRGSHSQAFTGRMRVCTPSGLFTHPDASIVFGEPELTRDTLSNPVVLVEVLSGSTGDYDRGEKFELYRSIETLRDYVLIEQSGVEVEHRAKTADGWVSETMDSLDQTVRLTGVDVEMPLKLIYERIEQS